MTENMKIAMSAINKWFYYAMNYDVIPVEVADFDGDRAMMLPDFFNAFPKDIRLHFAKKWLLCGSYVVLRTTLRQLPKGFDGVGAEQF